MPNFDYDIVTGLSGEKYKIHNSIWSSPGFCELVKLFKTVDSRIREDEFVGYGRFLDREHLDDYIKWKLIEYDDKGYLVLTNRGKWNYNKNKRRYRLWKN